jgi:phosphate transport system substrate-binding protein
MVRGANRVSFIHLYQAAWAVRPLARAGLLAALLLSLVGCRTRQDGSAGRGNGSSELAGTIKIDGSSTVYPMSVATAHEFEKQYPNVRVEVGRSGTGGGFKRFTQGETDISNASRPIKADEFAECQKHHVHFLEIPVAYDGLTIVVHPDNDWVPQLTVDQLKQIFLEGGTETWSAVQEGWPNLPIKVFAPGTDSGTFDYFKEVVVGKAETSMRSDMSTSEDDNVLVTGVAGEKGSIGFFGAAYYFENQDKVRAVAVVNPAGEAVLPTAETIKNLTYTPFSRPLFIYINASSLRRPEIKKYAQFQLDHAAEFSAKVKYVPLSEELYARAGETLAQRAAGSYFLAPNGDGRPGTLEEVYIEANRVDID